MTRAVQPHVCFFVLFLQHSVTPTNGQLHVFDENEVLNTIQTSCVVGVTEKASDDVYIAMQYLADVSYLHEEAVSIGFIELASFSWEIGKLLSWKESKNSFKKDILYFNREEVDRTCLLTSKHRWPKPAASPLLGRRDVNTLVEQINQVCNVYRTAEGNLSAAGLHRQYILQNLFAAENVTDVNMGRVYGLSRREIPRKGVKNDNSVCTLKPSWFHFYSPTANQQHLWKTHQCPSGQTFSKLVEHEAMHEATITKCETIDLPNFSNFFGNYLQISKPVIIKNAAKAWPAFQKWTTKKLRDKFGEVRVHIKLSPTGDFEGIEPASMWEDHETFNIPAIVRAQLPYPDLVVVRPATMDIKFSEFLDMIERVSNGTLKYVSAYLEYTSVATYFGELLSDVEEMPFIKDILKLKHQNIWLSDGNTLGKLHFDPFDNFLCQISGQKELILFAPHKNYELYEAHIPEALLGFSNSSSKFRRKTLLDSTSMVMSPVDILNPDFQRFPRFAEAYPMNCTIDEGDVLYLPAFWWHEVKSRPNLTEGRNLAINFWYEPFLTREFPCPECTLDVNPTYRHLL